VNSFLSALIVLVMLGGAILLFRWLLLRGPVRPADAAIEDGVDDLLDSVSVPLPAHLRAAGAEEGFHLNYWARALAERAGWRAILGLMLLVFWPGIMMIVGILLLTQGLLLVSPLLGSHVCVGGDRRTLTVQSLIGKKTLDWSKIEDVALRSFARRNLWVVFSTGTRHNLVVRGQQDFELVELLIPYPLLGLDRAGAKRLASRIMALRDGAAVAPERSQASSPRMPVAQRAQPVIAAAPCGGAPEEFDPDRIIARYLAERDAAVSVAQMLPVHRSATFGRKRAG
jgi:hypothetical protein